MLARRVLREGTMTPLLLLVLAASTSPADGTFAGWTERYFGVGSAAEAGLACAQARDHARGNSSNACEVRGGKRGPSDYTGCVCDQTSEGVHVCNVNLKVLCDGTLASTSLPGGQHLGGPKGRADLRREPPGSWGGAAGTDRPGSRILPRARTWVRTLR